ncbi:MAG: DUF2285 domain-containing protein [Acidimicrobiales bacterium]
MLSGGGCSFAEEPSRPATDARIFWRAGWDTSVLAVQAFPTPSSDVDAFNIRHFHDLATVLRCPDGHELLLFSDGDHRLQLDVTTGSVLAGPIRFRYELSGFKHIDTKILTLRRFVMLCRLRRFPRGLFTPERRARRWIIALQAYDGVQSGASQREIAAVLFGVKTVQDDWHGRSDYLRLRVQRAIRYSRSLVNGGYRGLL